MSKRHYAVAIVLLCLFVAAGSLPASAQRDIVVASTSSATKYPITPSMMSQFSMGLNPMLMSALVSPGNSGHGVVSLQRSLYLLGYLSESNITGTFDQTTLEAVKKFQCENNVVCSSELGLGTVGPQTRWKINMLIRARGAQLAAQRGYGRNATTTTPATPPSPPTTPVTPPIAGGGPTTVTTTARLAVRLIPSTSSQVLGFEPVGATGRLLAGPASIGGIIWWKVAYSDGLTGWSSGSYLKTFTFTDTTGTPPVKPICPMIAKMCPNGTYVSPSGPNCEFVCPSVPPPVVDSVGCVRAGCSSQLCVNVGEDKLLTTCEWRPEYACYSNAKCERQSTGQCGWTQTDSLKQCLANSTNTGATW